jgi:PTS system nitrogen regulatory IIA component
LVLEMSVQFGATLRLIRTDAGVSLRSLAAQIGVSSAYLSRVENGHDAVPTPDRLVEIARALGLGPTTLLELANKVEPFVASYLERVPAAGALFTEIARRGLTPAELARVRWFVDSEFPAAAPHGEHGAPGLSALLEPERVILRLSCTDIEDVIDIAAGRLAPAGSGITAEGMARMIAEREAESSTAIGGGVAVPHAIVRDLAPRAALVTLARPLDVATPDGTPLNVFFVMALHREGRKHLAVLARAARLAAFGVAERLVKARDPAQAIRLLEAEGL